ncbi:hypothetical protein ACEWY4_017678 [Coilia grayii]|uniref:RRM domain-containing protein n=1 Tax=Coilia grayii TaxID=363190 RepID=A0ABD1JIN7_9TELE
MKKKSAAKSDTSEAGNESTSYVVGQVSGCLFPNKSATGSGSLSALFSSSTAANTVLFVPAPKPVPTPVTPKDVPAKEIVNVKVQSKKSKKPKSAAELKLQDRESALQTADDDDAVLKGPKKAAKRKAPEVEDEDATGNNGRPPKRKMTFKDHAAERVKLNRTVFVGNLPVSCSKEALHAVFKEHGSIESIRFRSVVREDLSLSRKVAAIQRKVHPKKQSINAYIVFKDTEGASNALKRNGMEIQKDFHIRVDKASEQHDHKRSIFVGNLPYDVAELALRQHFQDCGDVEAVRLIRDRDTGMGKGFGYVLFENADAVQLALKLDGSALCERKIRVKRSLKDGKGAGAEGGKGQGRGKMGPGPMKKGPGPMKRGPGPMKRGPKGGKPNTFPRGGGASGGGNRKSFDRKPGKKTSPSTFKGEMANPTAKKHKGQKKKSKPRKKKNIHLG